MSQLLDKLNAYVPAMLWTLAPKHIIMQGAGLLATGDIVDLYWSGGTRLIFYDHGNSRHVDVFVGEFRKAGRTARC